MSDRNSGWPKFWTAVGVTVVVLTVALYSCSYSYYNIVNNARDECEKNLPRNQHCKIIAVPEEVK